MPPLDSRPQPDPMPDPTSGPDPTPMAAPDSISANDLSHKLARTLSSLCLEYRRLGAEISDLKSTQDSLREEVQLITSSLPHKKIIGDGWSTVRKQNKTKTINPNKLAEKGVGVDIIEYATEIKVSKEYVQIVVEKEKDETT